MDSNWPPYLATQGHEAANPPLRLHPRRSGVPQWQRASRAVEPELGLPLSSNKRT